MGVINIILSAILIALILKGPQIESFVNLSLLKDSLDYRARYKLEKQKTEQLEKRIEELEKAARKVETQKTPSNEPKPSFAYTGAEILRLINEKRRQNNIGELSPDQNLCYLANLRLSQILDLGKLDAHQGFIDFEPAKKFGYERVGENLAYGYETAAKVVAAWENSPGHNLNLKDPVNTLGCVASNQGFSVFVAGKEH